MRVRTALYMAWNTWFFTSCNRPVNHASHNIVHGQRIFPQSQIHGDPLAAAFHNLVRLLPNCQPWLGHQKYPRNIPWVVQNAHIAQAQLFSVVQTMTQLLATARPPKNYPRNIPQVVQNPHIARFRLVGPKNISAGPNAQFFTSRSYSLFSTDHSLTASYSRTPKNTPGIFHRWFKLLTLLDSGSWVRKIFQS